MLNELAKEIHQNAINKGWWEEERSFAEVIALCHSELSEALEQYRFGKDPKEIYTEDSCLICENCVFGCAAKPEGIPIELADCIILILSYCGHVRIDIDKAIDRKMKYNKTRIWKHGGKKI